MRIEKRAAALWVRLAKSYALILREVRNGEGGLSLAQFDVLAQLLRHPGGMTMSGLAEALLVTKGNTTGLVGRLAARGLVRRSRGKEDGRVRSLSLTPQGARLARREVTAHERRLRRIVGFPDIREALRRLRLTLERRS